MLKRTKVDLNFIKPNSTFVRPLYSENGEKILEPRTVLTKPLIDKIQKKYGNIIYSVISKDKIVIPHYRIKTAFNNSKRILEEIEKTNKLSKSGYNEAQKVIDDILSELYSIEIEEIELLKELQSFNEYLYNHSVNVGIMTAIFAKNMGQFTDDELRSITIGAYLIDIGQKQMDPQLLNKEGQYDINEFQKIKRHPQLGYEMLKNINENDSIILQSILFHHEKFNNRGYYQLPYENLPIYPKIVALCDIYDALTTERPFRKIPLSTADALRSIVNTTDLISDHKIVNSFINTMTPLLNNSEPIINSGDICELNSQELALVQDVNYENFLKPTVHVFCKFERKNNKLSVVYYKETTEIDLTSNQRYITKIVNNINQISAIKKSLIERKLLEF